LRDLFFIFRTSAGFLLRRAGHLCPQTLPSPVTRSGSARPGQDGAV